MRFSKKIVISLLVLLVIFTAAALYAFIKTGTEPVVLIGSVYGAVTGEWWMLSSLRKSEERKKKDE